MTTKQQNLEMYLYIDEIKRLYPNLSNEAQVVYNTYKRDILNGTTPEVACKSAHKQIDYLKSFFS